MNSLKWSLMVLVLVWLCSSASAGVLYFEDFESFDVGVVLHERAGWEGWYGDAGAAARVSDKYAFSGTRSVEVSASTDAVQVLDITEGKWVLTAMQYIPSGTSGITRFHMQNAYRDGDIGRSIQWFFSLSDGVIGDDYDAGASARIVYDRWIELKLIIDLDNDFVEQYYNGELISARAWVFSGTSRIQSIDLYGNGASAVYYDDIRIQDYLSSLVMAHNPRPESEATDVPRDVVLAWVAGRLADTHDVYFGTNAEDVAGADRAHSLDVLVGQGHGESRFDPEGLLDYGQTYYWRVDEVNAAPDFAIYRGEVWSFTVEPFAYPIAGIIATSNAPSEERAGPQNTVNGSGLDVDDQHSLASGDMWLCRPAEGQTPWIQWEFDRLYKLHQMLVWNYNEQFELVLGFGLKDVTVEYSPDGGDWIVLGDVQLNQGLAKASYTANTMIDFEGVAARFVRLTIHSGWGQMGQYGLSEVRFLHIPAYAREPQPADGQSEVGIDSALSWRAGRDAVLHEVYFGTHPDELSLIGSPAQPVFAPEGLAFGTAYYWRVDETADDLWAGDPWSFTTQSYRPIDDFESYTDDIDAGQAIFDTWLDGWVNNTGSTVGYLEAPFAERTIVHGGRQSMPLEYDNSVSPFYSETERTFDSPQDWTVGGADSLRLYFRGSAANAAQTLYVALEDNAGRIATVSHTDPESVRAAEWQLWPIPLSQFAGVDLSRVRTMYIGLGHPTAPTAGGSGLIYIDDIGFGVSPTQ